MFVRRPAAGSSFQPPIHGGNASNQHTTFGLTTWSSERSIGQPYSESFHPTHTASDRFRGPTSSTTPPVAVGVTGSISASLRYVRNVIVSAKADGCCFEDLFYVSCWHIGMVICGLVSLVSGLQPCRFCEDGTIYGWNDPCEEPIPTNWDSTCTDYSGENPISGASVVFFVFYGFILLGCWNSNTAKYLSNIRDSNDLDAYIDRVQNKKMSVSASVECYHYESRTSGSGKNRKTRRVKVTSHRESRDWNYNGCVDYSSNGVNTEGFLVVRVESRVAQEFGDSASSASFEALCGSIVRDNENRDRHISLSKHFDLPGIQELQLLRKDPNQLSEEDKKNLAWCSFARLMMLSFIPFASIFYLIWFRKLSGGAVLLFKKKLFLSAQATPPPQVAAVSLAIPLATAIVDSNDYWSNLHANNDAVSAQAFNLENGVDIELALQQQQ